MLVGAWLGRRGARAARSGGRRIRRPEGGGGFDLRGGCRSAPRLLWGCGGSSCPLSWRIPAVAFSLARAVPLRISELRYCPLFLSNPLGPQRTLGYRCWFGGTWALALPSYRKRSPCCRLSRLRKGCELVCDPRQLRSLRLCDGWGSEVDRAEMELRVAAHAVAELMSAPEPSTLSHPRTAPSPSFRSSRAAGSSPNRTPQARQKRASSGFSRPQPAQIA